MTISYVSATESRSIINAIRGVIGRLVDFYTVSGAECPVCSLDPVTNTSTNPYCTTCSGEGYLYTFTPVRISGHVTWAPAESLAWQTGGQYFDGDCRVQIEYTASNIAVLDTTDYVMIDGKRFLISKKMYRGVPELNRILIDMKEED